MSLQAIYEAPSDYARALTLFDDLQDDRRRAGLYQELAATPQVLRFQSRALPAGEWVHLLSARADVVAALTDADAFSNDPYAELGSGRFMLGLDDHAHATQRLEGVELLRYEPQQLQQLAEAAWQAAAVLPLKEAEFDVAALAEQVALRCVALLFGLPAAELPLLQVAIGASYRLLNFHIIGRHFVADAGVPPLALGALGKLGITLGTLIDAHARGRDPDPANPLRTAAGAPDAVLARLARSTSAGDAGLRAVIALGCIAGSVGNVQASVCNALAQLFERNMVALAKAHARSRHDAAFEACVAEALRLRPAAAFLPRRTCVAVTLPASRQTLPANSLLLLAMGAPACAGSSASGGVDPLLFGAATGSIHDCIGRHLAWPLIVHVLRRLVLLPGLAQCIAGDLEPVMPVKRWGVMVESWPCRYERQARLLQRPLKVVMRVKQPVAEHAAALRKVVAYGAPLIEGSLQEARHVHFAWFVFLDDDSKLALFTVFDGSFDAYIEHFALKVGRLFDLLFEHIEDAPPRPIEKFPKEFVETIRRYDAEAVGRYFYSAYPQAGVAAIQAALP